MRKWYFISPLILQKLIWVPTRLILIVFGGLEVKGLDNLKGIDTHGFTRGYLFPSRVLNRFFAREYMADFDHANASFKNSIAFGYASSLF